MFGSSTPDRFISNVKTNGLRKITIVGVNVVEKEALAQDAIGTPVKGTAVERMDMAVMVIVLLLP